MNFNVQTISKEIIKPSSQTPDHLKISNLSIFDQFVPPVYVPIIFFYEANESRGSNHVQISQNLKKSLSQTLTSFYPLAGRIHGTTIDCNDAGVEFIDTRVHSKLTESIRETDVEHLKKLLPLDPATAGNPSQGPFLMVQLNFFECGGIALAICVSHQIVDTASIMTFITAWAATHKGEHKSYQLGFELRRLFPAWEIPESKSNIWEALMSHGNLRTKMLEFTKEKLAALKRAAVSSTGSTVHDPTRVELVSSFIWQHLSRFYKNHHKSSSYAAFVAVNLRGRVAQNHPTLQNAFGNFILSAFVFPESDGAAEEYHESVSEIRSAIRSIDGELLADEETQESMVNDVLTLFSSREMEWFLLTSWCRFPIYEVDFGWGRPIWVCTPCAAMKNGAVLVDGRDGGVEAWIMNVDPEFLEILRSQLELIR